MNRLQIASIALLLFALAACGKPSAPAESPAALARKAQSEKIAAIEKDLARLDQMIAQAQQQQQDSLAQLRDQSRQIASQLADLKASAGAEAALPPLPEVPEESSSVLVVQSAPRSAAIPDAQAALARAEAGAAARPLPQAGRPSFFGRLFVVVVLIAIVFLAFKALNRWQEADIEDAEPDEILQTPEGAISLSPAARRQGADLHQDEDED